MKKTFKREMVKLQCDIELGGSTAQYLDWADRNISSSDFVDSLKKQLQYKAKTKPALMAKRSAVLMGLMFTEFPGNDRMLNCLCTAINQLNEEEAAK